MRIGPLRLGRPFYVEVSPGVSSLKLFGHWVYSRVGNVSRFSLLGLARLRVGSIVAWQAFGRDLCLGEKA